MQAKYSERARIKFKTKLINFCNVAPKIRGELCTPISPKRQVARKVSGTRAHAPLALRLQGAMLRLAVDLKITMRGRGQGVSRKKKAPFLGLTQ